MAVILRTITLMVDGSWIACYHMTMTPEQHRLVVMLAEMGKKLNPEFNAHKFLSSVDEKLSSNEDKPTKPTTH